MAAGCGTRCYDRLNWLSADGASVDRADNDSDAGTSCPQREGRVAARGLSSATKSRAERSESLTGVALNLRPRQQVLTAGETNDQHQYIVATRPPLLLPGTVLLSGAGARCNQ